MAVDTPLPLARPRPRPGTALANLRDLGGLPVRGGTIRPGTLLRSDDVALTHPAEAQRLVDAGLTDVVDLRSVEELTELGRGPLAGTDVAHHHLPLITHAGNAAQVAAQLAGTLITPEAVGRWYAGIVLAGARAIVAACEVIASTTGTVLVHCAAGKDRTGILTAAVLTVLGADHGVVVADYARTRENLPAVLERLGVGALPALPSALLDSAPETMTEMLDLLGADHGGLTAVLRRAGLDDRLVAALRARLVVA